MKVLLDTNIFFWLLSDSDRIPDRVREIVAANSTERCVSVASIWEMAIKYRLGKMTLPSSPTEGVEEWLRLLVARSLTIEARHALRAGELPRHHGDPFDRMLIAQAQLEEMTLVTSDRNFARYDVKLLRAW